MSNTLKLTVRTLAVVVLMAIGTLLSQALAGNDASLGVLSLSTIVIYTVYLVIGVVAGSAVSPRFAKGRSKTSYLIPLLIFLFLGLAQVIAALLPSLPLGLIIHYTTQFVLLSWALAGLFLAQLIR